MTERIRRSSTAWAVILLLGVAVGGIRAVLSDAHVREIRLVARGMAFYTENDPRTANPMIDLRPGETVRIVLTNLERGISHDLAIPALGNTALALLGWNETAAMTITAPTEPGTYEYVCRPHRAMMRGTLRVE